MSNGGRRRGRPSRPGRTHRRSRPQIWRCAACGSLVREGQLETGGCLARHTIDGKKQGRAAAYGVMRKGDVLCEASGDEVEHHAKLMKDDIRALPQSELVRLYVEPDETTVLIERKVAVGRAAGF